MKILYNHYHTDAQHPAVQMVEHISQGLRKSGHEVLIHDSAGLAKKNPDKSSGHVANRKSMLSGIKRCVWFAKAMARNRKWWARDLHAVQEFQPDVVLTRQDAYCWSMAQAAVSTNTPLVTYADVPVAYESRLFNAEKRWHPFGLVERIEKWGLSHSLAAITVSHPAQDRLRRYGLSVPIHVNHNGVDRQRFPNYSREERQKLKQELGLAGKTVIGFQGTFKSFHGIDRLRDLMLWTQGRSDVAWLLIGDGPERESLQEAVSGKTTAVFLGRRKPEEIGTLLSAMDIAVAPHSQMAGDFYFCPLKLLEYAASGCATIASQQGDIPLLLAHGKGGEMVRDDDLDSWCQALKKLIDNEQYRAQMGATARNHILSQLTWQDTADRVEKILCQVLKIPLEESNDQMSLLEKGSKQELVHV